MLVRRWLMLGLLLAPGASVAQPAQRPSNGGQPGPGGAGQRPPHGGQQGARPPVQQRPGQGARPPGNASAPRPPGNAGHPGRPPQHRPGAGRPPSFRPVHRPAFHYPRGYKYRRWTKGLLLPSLFLTATYIYNDYALLGVGAPPPGYYWVRYGPDLLLVERRTRRIADVIYGAFY